MIPLHHWKIRFLCCPCFASVVGTWFVHTLNRSCFLSFSILVATETKLSCIHFPWWAALTIEATEAGGAWRNTFWGGRQQLSSRNFIPTKIRISSSNDPKSINYFNENTGHSDMASGLRILKIPSGWMLVNLIGRLILDCISRVTGTGYAQTPWKVWV